MLSPFPFTCSSHAPSHAPAATPQSRGSVKYPTYHITSVCPFLPSAHFSPFFSLTAFLFPLLSSALPKLHCHSLIILTPSCRALAQGLQKTTPPAHARYSSQRGPSRRSARHVDTGSATIQTSPLPHRTPMLSPPPKRLETSMSPVSSSLLRPLQSMRVPEKRCSRAFDRLLHKQMQVFPRPLHCII